MGWYERDGEVLRHGADETYNRTLGTPVILYPDPEKDPTRDAAAQALWHEFGRALEGATHVLVLGHSLNDPALVHALSRIEPTIHLGIGVFEPLEHFDEDWQGLAREVSDETARVRDLFPGAEPIPCNFGPEPKLRRDQVTRWLTLEPDVPTA